MRTAIAGLAAAAVARYSYPALAPLSPAIARRLELPRRIESDAVALTFDDGPHPKGTRLVLEALEQHGASATFFFAGEQVERFPAIAREVAERGHGIGLHCHRHKVMLRLTPSQLRADLERGAAAIASATGVSPLLQRAPLGIYSQAGMRIVRRGGWRPLLWSQWGRDWAARATPESIADKLTGGVRRGDVLLLHDSDAYSAPRSWQRTAAALPAILTELERRGLSTASPQTTAQFAGT